MSATRAHILSGVRQGNTIGSPISIQLENKDWKNWQESLPVAEGDPGKHKAVASPRPGHADLAGALKYNFPEARYVLERASARESAARVAVGAMAKLFLRDLGIEVLSHVVASRAAWRSRRKSRGRRFARSTLAKKCCSIAPTQQAEQHMKEEVDKVLKPETRSAEFLRWSAHNVPPGLGTYAQWDERLDAMLAAAVMSLQAVKAVEIGAGIAAAASPGSTVHDEIGYKPVGIHRLHPRPQQCRRHRRRRLQW